MENYFSQLEKCSLFYNIEEKEILTMLNCLDFKIIDYPKDSFVFREGQPAEEFGIVLSGSVQIIKEDFEGNRTILGRTEESQLFGEAFACADLPYLPVSVIASEPSTILFLNCRRITGTCAQNCSFHRQIIFNLMKIIASKNLAFQQKIEITSRRTTREKLLAYLNIQAEQHHSRSFTIPYNRQELADYLGVERSAMSAEISKLKKEGILTCTRSDFTLL